jgi:undecaprenyl-diphosphatase
MDFLVHIDHSLFQLINQTWASTWQDVFFPAITDLHKYFLFKLIAPPLLFGFYFYKYKKMGILYFLLCILSLAATDVSGDKLLKQVVKRPRPFEVETLTTIKRTSSHGQSFISNHSSNTFAFATYTSAFFPAARPVLFICASLIAYSRVYNGVHFPLDVICGGLWGISISIFFILLARWIARKLNERKRIEPI